MTEQEINRAIQYVTASTSYGRDTVAGVVKTGLGELADFATHSSQRFDRSILLESCLPVDDEEDRPARAAGA